MSTKTSSAIGPTGAAILASLKAGGTAAAPARPARPAPPRMPRAATRPGAPLPGGAPAAPAVTSPAPVPVVTAPPPATPVAGGGGTPPASPPTPPGGGGAGGGGSGAAPAMPNKNDWRKTVITVFASIAALGSSYALVSTQLFTTSDKGVELEKLKIEAAREAARREHERAMAESRPVTVTIPATTRTPNAAPLQGQQNEVSIRKGEAQFVDLRAGSKLWFVKNGPAMVQKIDCDGSRQSTGVDGWNAVGTGQFISPSLGCVLVGVPMYQPNDTILNIALN